MGRDLLDGSRNSECGDCRSNASFILVVKSFRLRPHPNGTSFDLNQVRFGSLADISERTRDVRFTLKADMLSVSIDVR